MSPFRSLRRSHLPVFIFLIFLSGCLPTACQRRESRALFPADSLSRARAENTPIDTLALVWETNGNIDEPLEYPRTVLFGENGNIYASDVQANKIYEFLPSGILNQTYESSLFSFPYLVGMQGDTLMVLNPDVQRIDFMREGRPVNQVQLPTDGPENQRLQYVTIGAESIYYKVIGDDAPGYIAKLDLNGNVSQKTELNGPMWRHAGMLRLWGDTLISLSAYRPVVDIVTPGGQLDTLQLAGFDSPMLARSRAFILGDIDEPPLLIPSAAIANDQLYALNMRPGWLRIDQFDRSGQLTRRLVQNTPSFSKAFYPIDLDVRVAPDSTIELAVLFVEPEPRLSLFRLVK